MASRVLHNLSRGSFLMLRRIECLLPPFPSGLASKVDFSPLSFTRNCCLAKSLLLNPSLCKFSNAPMSTKGQSQDFDVGIDTTIDKRSKVLFSKIESLRVDLVLKAGLGISRNKVEKAFYQSRVRVNGKKILKKSHLVHENDEIDLIRDISPMNPEFLIVSRIEVLETEDEDDKYSVKLRRTKVLVVENYEEPWDGSDVAD